MSFFSNLFRPGKPGGREQAWTPIPVDQAEGALERLCQPPFTPDKFQRIEGLLVQLDIFRGTSLSDPRSWRYRPRTYTVLRNIAAGRHGEFMDRFVAGGYLDFHLPFDNRTLPGFLDSDKLRNDFLSFQHHVLSPEARSLEIEGGEHQLIPGSADAHFWSLEVLGQGGFGRVDRVLSKLSLNVFARKRVPRRKDSVPNLRRQNDFIKEVGILKKLSHRHLVNYIGSYTDNNYIAYLMHPVAECNLLEFLTLLGDPRNKKRKQVQPFFGCLASAVDYLHDQSIRHTDITTRNVLVTVQGEICLSDFGTATDFSQSGRSTTNDVIPVSIEYIAPEVAHRRGRNKSSDMWSLGVVFLEITTVLLGNDLASFRTFMARHAKNKDHPQSIWANLPIALDWLAKIMPLHVDLTNEAITRNEAITWVKSLLQDDPESRPTVKDLMVDIQQTPSFREFCCTHCWPEFEARAFDFETPSSTEGFNETMKHATAAEVSARAAALFDPQVPSAPIDASRSQSIENWITDSTSATVDAHNIPFSTWEGMHSMTVHRRRSLESLPQSVDETEASYATATPSNTGLRYTKEPTSKEMPANSADGDLGVDSGLGYLVEDDRSSEEEDAATKEEANLAQGFVIEEDSSGSEASYSEVAAILQPSHSSDSFEDQPRPLVQIPGRDSASSHVSKFGKEEPWELQMDDSDDYEEEEHSDEWALAPLESINRKALTMDTSNQLVLYRPDSDRDRSKQKAIMDTSYERSSDSHTWPVHGSQKNADASNTRALYLTWQPDESEGGKFADKTPPASLQFFDEGFHPSKPPPDYPPPFPVEHQDEYQKGSQSTTSSTLGDLFSGDNLAGPEKVLASPSHEQQPSKATSEMPTQRNMQGETSSHACEDNQSAQKVTDKAILRTLTIHDSLKERPSPKKSHSPKKRVRWGWMTVEKISRDLSDHEDLDKSKKSHHAENQATVEDVEDATETKSKHQQQQDLSDTDFGSSPSASVSLSMEPLEDKESVSSAPGLSVSPKSTKARARSQKREKKQASQSSKTKEAPKAANQGPAVMKRVPKPAESPTLFMEEARKAGQHAKSIATSQMSSGTKQALAGYNINRWVDHTNKLLERYCARGSARAVRTLLEQKCNPGTAAKPRRDPLLNAIRGASARHSKVVRLLLDYGVDVHIVAPRHYNKTPLHLAIENKPNDGYVNMVHDMVFARVDPNAKDRNGECALEKIFKGGGRLEKHRLDALALLLLSEADDGGGTRVNIRVPATRDTPLHLAVRRRSPMAAAMLLHRGADVNAANASGMTPLLAAALTWRHSGGGSSSSSAPATMAPDDEQMLDLLTSQPGVRLDGFAGTQRRTALHHAVVAGLPLAVEILLEKKADPRQPDADGKDAMALVGLGREEETADDEAIRRLLRDVLGE